MNQKRAITPSKGLDVFGAVEELHNLSAKEMNKLLRDSQNLFTLRLRTGRGSYLRVNLERLVSQLPLHLLACLASRGSEPRLRYLLRGVRLLHSLSDLALRHPKLAQIFLHEVKIREQILDLIVYMLITLAGPEQEGRHGSSFTILHAALVACNLHLLPAFVDGEWSDLVPVLLVHPKVDIFMDAAFDAVRRDIVLLQNKLRALNSKLMSNRVSANVAESMAEVIAQQCEASVQVLQSLCQPQAFRDKVLNHRELGRNGGVLQLVLAVLKLQVPLLLAESQYLVSLVARLKSKILSLMIKFCETESVSFLDEVAADAKTMHLAEMVATEVLTLVRKALLEEHIEPQVSDDEEDEMLSGLLYIHTLRLADIFSDDSNFRNSVMDFIAPDLAKVLAQSPTSFLAGWCGTAMTEEIRQGSDSVLIYDPFKAAGAAMHSFKSTGGASVRASGSNAALLPDDSSGCSLSGGQFQFASYSQERSSLFVKILANLHCFNPEICPADEKDRFLNLFVECLMSGPFTPGNSAFFLSTVQTAVRVCENLFMLLDHVSSLSSEAVSDEDLQLVSTFYCALHETICPSPIPEDCVQEDPVVAYVRDAHEQKRKAVLGQWQKSERWKRLHLFEPSDDHDESNAGSSINKTTSNSSSSQPAGNEKDTCGFVEEAQDDGELSGAKRSREAFEADDSTAPTRKKHQIGQLWGVDLRQQMVVEAGPYSKPQVLDGDVRGCAFGTLSVMEDDAAGEVANEDTHEFVATHGGILAEQIAAAAEQLAHGFPVHIEIDSGGVHEREVIGTSGRDGREHMDELGVDREHEDDLGDKKVLLSSEASLPQGTSTQETAPTPSVYGAYPSKDAAMLHGNLTQEIATASHEHEKHAMTILEVYDGSIHHENLVREMEVKRLVTVGTPATCVDGDNIEVPDSVNCGTEKRDTSMLNLDSCKINIHVDAVGNDRGGAPCCIDYAGEKNVVNGVEMDHGDLTEGNAVEFESARVRLSERTDCMGNGTDDVSRAFEGQMDASCVERPGAHNDKAMDRLSTITLACEAAHCPESSMTEGLSVKRDRDGSTCVQGFGFGLEVEDMGVPEVMVWVPPMNSNQNKDVKQENQHLDSLRHLAAGVNAQPDIKWRLSQNIREDCIAEASKVCVLKASQVSLVEASKVPGRGAPQAFGLGGSQLHVTTGSLVSTSGTSQVSGLDASRFCTAMEAKDHAFGGCPLPKPIPLPVMEEFPVRKRKRNIMSDEQMAVMENALKTDPYMRRHPELIMQMTHTLNKMGPEVSYQQLKNWLNNRKARLARQRAAEPPGELRACVYNQDGSAPSSTGSGSSNDPNRSTSEDGGNTRDSGSTLQARKSLPSFGIPLCKLATEDIDAIMDFDMSTLSRSHMSPDLAATNGTFVELDVYGRHNLELSEMGLVPGPSQQSGPVKFVKCETGQFVSLLDKDGKEAATGTLYQVEGIWQGKRIDEHGICIVKIVDLNVDKSSRLPHPSPFTGSTFEEAEKLCGLMLVAWDTKRIFLIS